MSATTPNAPPNATTELTAMPQPEAMNLPSGPAFLALWNHINDEARRDEYEQWHVFEHVPERVALPGFVGADRYRSVDSDRGYFTLYHLDGLHALQTELYRDVFTHPTPWSARMRPVLSQFYRLPCVCAGQVGASRAPQLATLRWSQPTPAVAAALNAWLQAEVDAGALVHAQWGWAPPTEAYWLANVTSDTARDGVEHVAVLQHYSQAGVETALARLQAFLAYQPAQAPVVLGSAHIYQLQTRIDRCTDPAESVDAPIASFASTTANGRRPPHTRLFNHYNRG